MNTKVLRTFALSVALSGMVIAMDVPSTLSETKKLGIPPASLSETKKLGIPPASLSETKRFGIPPASLSETKRFGIPPALLSEPQWQESKPKFIKGEKDPILQKMKLEIETTKIKIQNANSAAKEYKERADKSLQNGNTELAQAEERATKEIAAFSIVQEELLKVLQSNVDNPLPLTKEARLEIQNARYKAEDADDQRRGAIRKAKDIQNKQETIKEYEEINKLEQMRLNANKEINKALQNRREATTHAEIEKADADINNAVKNSYEAFTAKQRASYRLRGLQDEAQYQCYERHADLKAAHPLGFTPASQYGYSRVAR